MCLLWFRPFSAIYVCVCVLFCYFLCRFTLDKSHTRSGGHQNAATNAGDVEQRPTGSECLAPSTSSCRSTVSDSEFESVSTHLVGTNKRTRYIMYVLYSVFMDSLLIQINSPNFEYIHPQSSSKHQQHLPLSLNVTKDGSKQPASRSSSIWSGKSTLSAGFRYTGGHLINTSSSPSPDAPRVYLFESMLGKER